MKTSNFRHKVFCMAYELMKATGKAFAVCLSRAWALYRLTKQMHKGIVSFAYEKSDGSLRKAKGTLKDIQNLIKKITSAVTALMQFCENLAVL